MGKDASDLEQDKEQKIEEIQQDKNKTLTELDKKMEEKLKENKILEAFMQDVKKVLPEKEPELTLEQKQLLAERIMQEEEEKKAKQKAEKKLAKNRLIDTTQERGIKEEQLFLPAQAYLDKHRNEMTPEQIKEWEQKANDEADQERLEKEAIDELRNIQKNKSLGKEIKQELQISPEEIFAETQLRLKAIIAKDKRGETLSNEEMQMLVLNTQIMKAEQELEHRLESAEEITAERIKLDNQIKQTIIKEYNETKKKNPELIIKNGLGPKQEGFVVGKNFLKSMAFIVGTHWAIKYGYCKLVKVWKDKGVEEIYLKKMPKFVEFWSKNERGEDQVNICKVRIMNYRLQGTTIPVCYAVEGFIDAFDFFGNMRDEYTQELFQKAQLLGYWAGVLKGKETFPDQKEESFWSKYKLLLILGGIMLLLIGLAYYAQFQQIQDMTTQIDTLTTLLKANQVDMNAMIIRGGKAVLTGGA